MSADRFDRCDLSGFGTAPVDNGFHQSRKILTASV